MLSHIPNLGAINKLTKLYCCAKLADKKEEYICPECNKDLIIRQGTKRIHHFAHYKDDNPCNYYNNPNETQIHKDAKLALKQILETGIKLKINRKCCSCKCDIYDWDVPSLKNCNIEIEYRFDYNNSLKIADLAVLYKNNIYTIFEIYNSHKTINDARPKPWFEFDAKHIINSINKEQIVLECIRKEKCDYCLQKQYIKELHIWLKMYGKEWNGDQNVLENLVRKVLGQTEFKKCNVCNNTRWIKDDKWGDICKDCNKPDHLRFDFDAQEQFQENKDIIDIFNSILLKYVVIHSHKGGIVVYIINKKDKMQYNYYNTNECYILYCKHPYKCKIDFGGDGTVDIIIAILHTIYHHLPFYNKMTQIKLDYHSKNPKILDYKYVSNETDDNDVTDASTSRYMRRKKQKENEVKSYNMESILNDNNIEFTENNNVITIIHPHTKEKIRRSMVTNKTYFQKECITSITLQDIIAWYKSTSASFSKEKLYLQVLFSEKDIVKGLGARWDIDTKKWYVSDTFFNKEQFSKWIK
jgi:hypothetical protein